MEGAIVKRETEQLLNRKRERREIKRKKTSRLQGRGAKLMSLYFNSSKHNQQNKFDFLISVLMYDPLSDDHEIAISVRMYVPLK